MIVRGSEKVYGVGAEKIYMCTLHANIFKMKAS